MSTEPITGLTYQEAGSLQTDVLQNAEINHFGAWVQCVVLSVGNNAPPGTPVEGGRYIVGTVPTGAWASQANKLAVYRAAAWEFYTPQAGWRANITGGSVYEYSGSAWAVVGAVSSVNGATGAVLVYAPIIIACSDETTALTTGTAKVTFRMPYAFTLTAVRASVTTAPTGAALTVDINEGGVSILSTLLTIDAGEKTSTTAATPAVISDTALADDAEITIDIDTVGSTVAGAGLKVTLIGYRP